MADDPTKINLSQIDDPTLQPSADPSDTDIIAIWRSNTTGWLHTTIDDLPHPSPVAFLSGGLAGRDDLTSQVDGERTSWMLSVTPIAEDNLLPILGNTVLTSAYSLSGNIFSLDTAPASGTRLVVYILSNPASDGIDTVFGRTGTIVAVSGDYDADEITETASNKIMTAAERTKLTGVEADATADQTDTEILTAWQTETGRTVATDAAKLDGIETAATADQSDAEIETAYNAQVPVTSGPEITAGTETAVRRVSPDIVRQMAVTHGGGGGGGVTDHGALTGLADDDHTQYHNDTRGDARYHQISDLKITTDASYSTVFYDSDGAYIETGATNVMATSGVASFPNRVGDDTNTINGTDYDGTHVAGALWKSADSAYVAGAADYAGIIGGYDCLNNQIGGWIEGSNHSVLMYNAQGHSYIAGGSYNLIESGRSAIVGSTACAITGTSSYCMIASGRDTLVDDNSYSLVVGQDNTVNAGSSNLVVGTDLTMAAGHNNSALFGQDGSSPGRDCLTRSSTNLDTNDDVRVWDQIMRKTTTDASGPGSMLQAMDAFPTGKRYSGWVKAKVVAMDSASDAQAAFSGETSWFWNATTGQGNFGGGANGSGPYYNLSLLGTDKISSVGTVRLALDGGKLRAQVQGKAATTIRWVAKIEVVSTAATT